MAFHFTNWSKHGENMIYKPLISVSSGKEAHIILLSSSSKLILLCSQLIVPTCDLAIFSVEVYLGHSRPHLFADIMTDERGGQPVTLAHMILSADQSSVVPGQERECHSARRGPDGSEFRSP